MPLPPPLVLLLPNPNWSRMRANSEVADRKPARGRSLEILQSQSSGRSEPAEGTHGLDSARSLAFNRRTPRAGTYTVNDLPRDRGTVSTKWPRSRGERVSVGQIHTLPSGRGPLRDVNGRNHAATFPIWRSDFFDLTRLALAFVGKADGTSKDRPQIEFDLADVLRFRIRKPMKVDESAIGHLFPNLLRIRARGPVLDRFL